MSATAAPDTWSAQGPTALLLLGFLLERGMTEPELAATARERAAEAPAGGAAPGPAEIAGTAAALRAAGLVEAPDGTVQQLTDRGRSEFERRVGLLIATPEQAQPEFFTAVGYLGALDRETAVARLRTRTGLLRSRVDGLAAAMAVGSGIPRLYLIETEYAHRLCSAELAWVEEVLAEIGTGALAWPAVEVTADGWEWEPQAGQATLKSASGGGS